MKIDVIGGGPAGLYFAILAKKSFPRFDIRVHERNQADDTFGFGVVFSDATLDNFERADKESYEAITSRFAYWDDIEIHIPARCIASAATAFAAARAALSCCSFRSARARSASSSSSAPRSPRSTNSAIPISWSRPMVSTAASARTTRRISAARSTCVPTGFRGWDRHGPLTPSPSSSRKPSTASSSPIAINTKPTARPSCSRPIPTPL